MKSSYRELLHQAIEYASASGSFNSLNLIEKSDNFCIWGCGKYFMEAYEKQFMSRGYAAKYVVDSNQEKTGKVFFDSVRCISPEELFRLDNPVVIPLLNNGRDEVIVELKKHNITWIEPQQYFFDMQDNGERSIEWFEKQRTKIFEVYQMLEDDESKRIYANVICNRIANKNSQIVYKELYSNGQYFNPQSVYAVEKNECFVDVGAFDGDSIAEFINFVGYNFHSIHAFELSKKTFEKLENRVKDFTTDIQGKIHCYNYGAWNIDIELPCGEEKTHTGEGCSINKGKNDFLDEDEREVIRCLPLDQLLYDEPVTLLKMDVEGAEQNALKGCKNIIQEKKPKLAICIYHNVDDLWEIPIMIKQLVPEYKLFVRHHTKGFGDTVCYAIVD